MSEEYYVNLDVCTGCWECFSACEEYAISRIPSGLCAKCVKCCTSIKGREVQRYNNKVYAPALKGPSEVRTDQEKHTPNEKAMNLKDMTIGKKLVSGFAIVVAITLLLGGFGYYGAVHSDANIEDIGQLIGEMQSNTGDATEATGDSQTLSAS